MLVVSPTGLALLESIFKEFTKMRESLETISKTWIPPNIYEEELAAAVKKAKGS
jgi:hypothetical protein